MAGKTGTAENGESEPTPSGSPVLPPRTTPVAIAVVVENGGGLVRRGSGNLIAAPIAKKVLEAVLNK